MPQADGAVHIAQTPLVRAAAFCSVLAAVAAFVPAQKPKPLAVSPAPIAAPGLRPVCGQRAIVEVEVCIPLPGKNAPLGPAEAQRAPRSAADDAPGAFLPRRPDRPADFNVYTFPVEADEVLLMPRSVDTKAPGEREGINIKVSVGDKVKAADVEGADDTVKVVFVGQDVGVTVATLHTIHGSDKALHVLVIYGHLDRPGGGVVAGSRVHNGDVIGFAGDSG
ncbi:MAG: hypothetical protein IPK82_13305 [Polyangiaceae bacterium]|nr:hypothetical protein [Polyangiaceae bacterium]